MIAGYDADHGGAPNTVAEDNAAVLQGPNRPGKKSGNSQRRRCGEHLMTDDRATLQHCLTLARQRASDAAVRVAPQRRLVARLLARGHPTREAMEMLQQLLIAQRHFDERCAAFERQVAAMERDGAMARRRLRMVSRLAETLRLKDSAAR